MKATFKEYALGPKIENVAFCRTGIAEQWEAQNVTIHYKTQKIAFRTDTEPYETIYKALDFCPYCGSKNEVVKI